nr:hypothetical protein [Tanacetum cinerariifolium]
YGHLAKECRKPKWVKDYSYHKEKMMFCKQEEKGVPLCAEQSDWLHDTDEEPNEQELEGRYMYMAKIQEEDHNADDHDEDERVELSNLIENLKLDIDENKKLQKKLKKANATLTHNLNESKYALTESNDIRDRCRSVIHQKRLSLRSTKRIKIVNLKRRDQT